MSELTAGRQTPSALRIILMTGTLGGILGTMAGLPIHQPPTVLAETGAEEFETVSGILSTVNVAEKKGMIKTDLGKQVAFQIVKPELFINLSVGQRVTLKLDKEGRAVRVSNDAAPELPPPSAPR